MPTSPGDGRFQDEVIVSSANPLIKRIRSLQRRKIRLQERAFIVEGVRAVEDELDAGLVPQAVVVRDDVPANAVPLVPRGVPVRRVAARLFAELSEVPHPQGILAVAPMPEPAEIPDPSLGTAPLIMVVDGVRDPGNLGTLLRSAAGAGVDHVVIAPETVDPYHPRAVRAAMGSHFRVPMSQRSWPELASTLRTYDVVGLADAAGDAVYDTVRWTLPSAIVVGGEAFGPSAHASQLATVRVSIPLERGVESLNAGVAGSLLVFEAARQRRGARTADDGSDVPAQRR